jgi:hypothetical protein
MRPVLHCVPRHHPLQRRHCETLALRLAREPSLLARYRARLAANRATHPLFDMARFTHALDDVLQAAWENRSSPMPSSIAS